MPCDMNLIYYTTSKPEYIEYIPLYMLFRGDTLGRYKIFIQIYESSGFSRTEPNDYSPNILKKILHKIEEDIKSHARLKLCEDPETNIWSYYGMIKLMPIVLEDYLMLILTVPLIDQSLHMNLYKVHNLPMLHPTLHVHAQYELEGSYLATLMEGMFITLPTALDIRLCLMMNGHLCMFNQALYPVECMNWCIYALFINDKDQIERNCLIKNY